MQRLKGAFRGARDWCTLFGRRLRKALKSRFVLAPLLCIISLAMYSHYVTSFNFFLIIEDDQVTIHRTYTRDPVLVLAEAGIDIRATDLVSIPDGEISGSAAEIQIMRTSVVYVTLEGITLPISLRGGTVADALDKAGYLPSPLQNVTDVISPPDWTPVEEGMSITVKRYVVLTEREYETIPFSTIEQTSANVNIGARVTTTSGADGRMERISEMILLDGEVIFQGVRSETVLEEPVTEVIVRGTGGGGAGVLTLADGSEIRYTRRLVVECTAYTTERQVNKINALGKTARLGTIAVDPKFVPLRTRVFVTSNNGTWIYGEAIAEDTGGKVKGNIIDLFMETYDECIRFGRRQGYMYILE
jgi:3D (Asp-Asp-Asp) domain-containing protein